MNQGVIITLPKSDDVTEYLSVFSKPIIDECSKQNIKLKKLEKDKANRSDFEKLLKSIDYKMIIFNGHGSVNEILGHKNKELISAGKNDSLLTNRITYSRSCYSLQGVGNSSMKNNTDGCFIGYKIPFMFLIDLTHVTNPSKDNIAKIFFETSNLIPITIIKGNSVKEAHDNSRKSMLRAIKSAIKKKNKDSEAIAETLWNNYLAQGLVGNFNATLR